MKSMKSIKSIKSYPTLSSSFFKDYCIETIEPEESTESIKTKRETFTESIKEMKICLNKIKEIIKD